MRRKLLAGVGVATVALWGGNTSVFHGRPQAPRLLAHRGVHQTFAGDGLTAESCTAQRIHEPTHGFVENTLPSIAAAVEAGADWVEVDVRTSSDGAWMVFHDHGLDCRTDGTGAFSGATESELRELDLGYGYTHDGKSYPLRGRVEASMPSLQEVLAAFPEQSLLLDLKGLDAAGAQQIAGLLGERPVMATGTSEAVEALVEAHPGVRGLEKSQVKRCFVEYAALGWSGWVPNACRGRALMTPANYAPWLWGWPHRLAARLQAADAELIVIGPRASGDQFSRGVDDVVAFEELGFFDGIVWTNRIELLGPLR